MYISDRRKLQNTWHDNMSSEEKDIYFCNMKIISMQRAQEDDRILTCYFGLSDDIINANRYHRDAEKANIKRYEELTKCQTT